MFVVSDKLRDQVRQLLALAADPGASASEREVAMTRASILMARHSITSLDVEDAEREDIEVRELVVDGGPSTPSLSTCMAIAGVADAAGLFAYYTDYRRVRGRPHILVRVAGFRSDLEWFMPLAMTLTAYAATGWVAWRRANAGRYRRSKTAHRRRLRDGFITGFGAGVAGAVRDARAEAIADEDASPASSRALVVRSRTARINEWAEALDLVPGDHLDLNADTRNAGYNAGRASHLGCDSSEITGRNTLQLTY